MSFRRSAFGPPGPGCQPSVRGGAASATGNLHHGGSRRRRGHPRTHRRRLVRVPGPSRARTTGACRAESRERPGGTGPATASVGRRWSGPLGAQSGLIHEGFVKASLMYSIALAAGFPCASPQVNLLVGNLPSAWGDGSPGRPLGAPATEGHVGTNSQGARDATRARMPGDRARLPEDDVVPVVERPRKEQPCLTSPAAPWCGVPPGRCR